MKGRMMKKRIMICAAAVLILGAVNAQADMNPGVYTFDDLPYVSTYAQIPVGYGGAGVTWSNMYYINGPLYQPGSGYDNGTVSAPFVAFNAYGNPALVSDGLFDFGGAYLTAAWNDGLNIKVEGYLGYSLRYTQTVVVNTSGPTWFDFNYYGIDELKFDSYGSQFAMDNFTVVPVPAAVLLGMLGLSAVGVKLRKFA